MGQDLCLITLAVSLAIVCIGALSLLARRHHNCRTGQVPPWLKR